METLKQIQEIEAKVRESQAVALQAQQLAEDWRHQLKKKSEEIALLTKAREQTETTITSLQEKKESLENQLQQTKKEVRFFRLCLFVFVFVFDLFFFLSFLLSRQRPWLLLRKPKTKLLPTSTRS